MQAYHNLSAYIDNRKKEVSTKLWYSTIGHLATRWLSPFSGLYAYDFHCSIQKRRGKIGRNVSFNKSHVLYGENIKFGYRTFRRSISKCFLAIKPLSFVNLHNKNTR